MTLVDSNSLKGHEVVSHEQWLAARTEFLKKEKEFTKLRDDVTRQRRELPWEKVEKEYEFDTPSGKQTLAELFGDKSQLVVYHFMFGPDWDEGCAHCSFWADNFNGIDVHLNHRDVTFLAISRAPLAKIEEFKTRMGWSFPWVSSGQTDFNFDYNVSFTPEQLESGTAIHNYAPMETDGHESEREGISVFYKDDNGAVYHTYSCYARGIDLVNGAYNYLDLTPKGRDEDGPEGVQAWIRYHDRYDD